MQSIVSKSAAQTIEEGCRYAAKLNGCEVIALGGDLGSGKTHFVKGIARGLNISGRITSPTFNILHEYAEGRLKLFHFDMYRIDSLQLVDVGYYEALQSGGVTVIEWAQNVADSLPPDTIFIDIEYCGENCRIIHFR